MFFKPKTEPVINPPFRKLNITKLEDILMYNNCMFVSQPTQKRRKNVLILVSKTSWSEMEVATTFFWDVVKMSSKRRPQDIF